MDKKIIPTPGFTSGVLEELKKVDWPTKKQTVRLTLIVVGVSLIIGIYIGIIDVLLTKGLEILTRFR